MDTLSHFDGIYVPGLEPLEYHQPYMQSVSVNDRLAWLQTLFEMPSGPARNAWFEQLQAEIPGLGAILRPPEPAALISGLKMRPSVLLPGENGGLHSALRWLRDHIKLPERAARAVVKSGLVPGFGALADILAATGTCVIGLHRKNVLRQALAMYRMNRQGHSQFSGQRSATHVDPAVLQRHLTDHENARAMSDSLLDQMRGRGIPVMGVVYEDLDSDPAACVGSVLEFIGQAASPEKINNVLDSKSGFRKTGGEGISSIVSNDEELRDHFRNTNHEKYF